MGWKTECRQCDQPGAARALLARGADVEQKTRLGWFAAACCSKSTDASRRRGRSDWPWPRFLQAQKRRSPLCVASLNGSLNALNALLESGAKAVDADVRLARSTPGAR